ARRFMDVTGAATSATIPLRVLAALASSLRCHRRRPHMGNEPSSFFRRNGLSLVLLGLFGVFLSGQVWSGFLVHNAELLDAGAAPESLRRYLASGHFLSATFENWESEFLQMGMYVLLTVG